jgi:hypothetical protein
VAAVPGPEAVVAKAVGAVTDMAAPAVTMAPVLVPAATAVAAITMLRAVPAMVLAVEPVRPRTATVRPGGGLH